jgi:flagellar protein FlaF
LQADPYEDIRETSSEVGRERERIAFDRAIALLEAARDGGNDLPLHREAVFTIQNLWRFLIRDLTHPANDLSDDLKDNLVSIGLWTIEEADRLIAGKTNDWTNIIEITRTVRKGLD